ncbi:MAG: ergothioneine biosynthesis glutamate--cysteine ligase EgtA [Actinoplanes sp.]
MTKSIRSVRSDADGSLVLRHQDDVEERIRAICFKTGPPTTIGAELEWTLHHTAAPGAPLTPEAVRRGLGPHTPQSLTPDSPELSLPGGGRVTLEPGGQVEISSAPASSLTGLHTAVETDLGHLTRLLAEAGLSLGEHGLDPHREPRRLLRTPRYDAMESIFDTRGPHGRQMMCSTAGLQVCLDAGPAGEVATRWAAVNALGPPLLAAFATSGAPGWASGRMATWWGMDPRLTHPVLGPADDPAAGWVRYALTAPVVAVRRDDGNWSAPAGLTLCDWVTGAWSPGPTVADLDYHLSTLFPPVRPRGYLEVRYLDAQPARDWFAPVAVMAALFAQPAVTDAVLDLAAPTADRWVEASRAGLADPELRRVATAVLDLACRHLDRTGLPPGLRNLVTDTVHRRLRDAGQAQEQ